MIFVTGGAGLVGAALLKQLLEQNKGPIKALYRNNLPPALTQEEIKKIEWVQGDVLDTSLLIDIMKDCKQVYHSAAIVSYHKSRRQQMYKINIEGTANMVNAALENKIEKFVQVSSVAAIGHGIIGKPITEENKWSEENNNSHYGTTKYLSELEVWRAISEGLNAVIVNPSIILGEALWDTGSAAIFKKVWNEFPWYTNGGTAFVDSRDVANAMIQLMDSSITAQRFLVCNENLTFKELFTKIAIQFGKNPPHREIKKWMGELVWRLENIKSILTKQEPLVTKETIEKAQVKTYYNNSKLLQALPDFKFTTIDVTIERTCKWLKEHYQLK